MITQLTEVPKSVWLALENKVQDNELEFADNYRAYRINDNFNKAEFDKSLQEGCCGFFETKIILEDGEQWIVGCNYGH